MELPHLKVWQRAKLGDFQQMVWPILKPCCRVSVDLPPIAKICQKKIWFIKMLPKRRTANKKLQRHESRQVVSLLQPLTNLQNTSKAQSHNNNYSKITTLGLCIEEPTHCRSSNQADRFLLRKNRRLQESLPLLLSRKGRLLKPWCRTPTAPRKHHHYLRVTLSSSCSRNGPLLMVWFKIRPRSPIQTWLARRALARALPKSLQLTHSRTKCLLTIAVSSNKILSP